MMTLKYKDLVRSFPNLMLENEENSQNRPYGVNTHDSLRVIGDNVYYYNLQCGDDGGNHIVSGEYGYIENVNIFDILNEMRDVAIKENEDELVVAISKAYVILNEALTDYYDKLAKQEQEFAKKIFETYCGNDMSDDEDFK